jgi:hypothetical protein
MKKVFPIILVALVAVFWIRAVDFEFFHFVSCDSPVIKETRKVGAFSKIRANSVFDIEYRYSATVSCEIEGPQDYVKATQVSVSNDVLNFKLVGNFHNSGGEPLKVYLSGPEFKGAELSGAAELSMSGPFPAAPIDINLSGASELTGPLNSPDLQIDLSGASELSARGKAQKARMVLCGASEVNGDGFTAEVLTISLSGASSARVRVNKTLDANASGASELIYIGKPGNVNRTISGASSIENENE